MLAKLKALEAAKEALSPGSKAMVNKIKLMPISKQKRTQLPLLVFQ